MVNVLCILCLAAIRSTPAVIECQPLTPGSVIGCHVFQGELKKVNSTIPCSLPQLRTADAPHKANQHGQRPALVDSNFYVIRTPRLSLAPTSHGRGKYIAFSPIDFLGCSNNDVQGPAREWWPLSTQLVLILTQLYGSLTVS